jgi:hypothetical protein
LETVQHLTAKQQSLRQKLDLFKKETIELSEIESLNLIQDLDGMNEAIDSFQNLAVLNDVEQLPASIQRGIDASMIPIYHHMKLLLGQVVYSKKNQKDIQENVSFIKHLAGLKSILQNSARIDVADFKKTVAELHALRNKIEGELTAFDGCLQELDSISPALEAEAQITQTLKTVCLKGGLLPQLHLAVAARIEGKRVTFKESDIQNKLRCLPDSEREDVLSCITAVTTSQDAGQLKERYDQLRLKMQKIFQSHDAQIKGLIQLTDSWTEQYIQSMQLTLLRLKDNLIESSEKMAEILQNLTQLSKRIRIRKVEALPAKAINAMGGYLAAGGAAIGALLGWGLSGVLGPIAGPIAGLVAGGLWGYSRKRSISLGAIGGCAAGAVASAAMPYFAPAVPIVLGALGGKEALPKAADRGVALFNEKIIFPQVMEVFDNLYDFILQPHVWQWAITDSLNCVNNAFAQPEEPFIIDKLKHLVAHK